MDYNTQTKLFIFMERLWLVGALIGVLCTIYFLIIKDNDSALYFFAFFILASICYLMRKRQRIKHQGSIKK
jgi:uncharacterized membrane protein YfcA